MTNYNKSVQTNAHNSAMFKQMQKQFVYEVS